MARQSRDPDRSGRTKEAPTEPGPPAVGSSRRGSRLRVLVALAVIVLRVGDHARRGVVAAATVLDVVAGPAVEIVGTLVALEGVVATVPVEGVVAVVALEVVGTVATGQRVVAVAALERVV